MHLLTILIIFIECAELLEAVRPRFNSCPTIRIPNGRSRLRVRNGFIQFQCNQGFLLAGERYMKCLQGQWEGEIPKCVRGTCSSVNPPLNGFVFPSYKNGVLNFFCKAHYKLVGPPVSYCNGRKWSSHLPSCIETNRSVSLTCDFEHEDLCGWMHDINHDFDWIRKQLHTPSSFVGTGPSFDHTKGDAEDPGYYMYIEATSRNFNDTARLISPTYPKQENNICFEFFYHMYGVTTGELRVYLKKVGNADWNLKLEDAVFVKRGNRGNKWHRGFIPLGSIDDDFQIIIEGVRGNGYLSDIAIDDVKIYENCVIEEEITESTTDSSSSTYETRTDFFYGSCANSCGEQFGSDLKCGCYYECLENNTCCYDYIPLCGIDDYTLSDETTTSEYQSETTESDSPSTESTIIVMLPTSTLQQPSIMPETTYKTTELTRTTLLATTTRKLTTSKATTNRTTRKLIRLVTKMATKMATTAKPSMPFSIKPVIPSSTTNNDSNNIPIFVPPFVKRLKTTTTSTYRNDLVTLPNLPDTAEYVTLVAIRNETSTHFQQQQNAGGRKLFFSIFAFVACSVLIVLIVWLRRRYVCGRLKNYRNNSYGDSQSDVRFLTSDEVLDFTIASPN